MESREDFFSRLNQARVRSNLKPTVPKPFRLRTKERSEIRASNAEKGPKQMKGRADFLEIEKLPNSSEEVGSHLEKESVASVSKDVIPSPTRTLANRQSASRPNEKMLCEISELECKVHTLQGELTTLSAQLTLMQRDRLCMIANINELQLCLQNMEQQVHLQRDEFFALHDALWERVQHLELVKGQEMPNHGSQYAGSNHKSTVLCSDISSNNGCQPVAAAANPLSAARVLSADSQQRTSIDPLNFISLESFGGVSLTEEGPGDFEFIMGSAINCSFDGSNVPEAWNCVTPTGISIHEGPNQIPVSIKDGEPCTRGSQKKLYIDPLDEVNKTRQYEEDLGYWEKLCMIDSFDLMTQSNFMNESSDEGNEEGFVCYWEKPYIDPFDELTEYHYEPLDEVNETRQEEKDLDREKPYTMLSSSEVICKEDNPYWQTRMIKEYLAKPGLSDDTVALCLRTLDRIAGSSFYDPLKYDEEEEALFADILDYYLNCLLPCRFLRF